MKKITDRGFRYTPSFATDIRRTFRKIEQERKRDKASTVVPIDTTTGTLVVHRLPDRRLIGRG